MWIDQALCLFHHKPHPRNGCGGSEAFLTHLAVQGRLRLQRKIRQRRLCYFCIAHFKSRVTLLENVEQAKVSRRLQVVLTVNETRAYWSG